jgi:hypothetical protein
MQPSNSYSINFEKLAAWLTPAVWRKTKLGMLLNALVAPLTDLHSLFTRFRDAKLYQLKITPQVCYLTRLLNDRFDFTARRIRIEDAQWHLPWFIFQEAELKPQAIFQESENKPKALFTEGESGQTLLDFVVLVPLSLKFSEPEMRALLDNYKLFGTQYTIQRV